MNFSMNGFRRQLSSDTEHLRNIVNNIVNDQYYDKDDLIDTMNKLVTHSNVVNCVFHSGDPDFADLSDMEIEHIEQEE